MDTNGHTPADPATEVRDGNWICSKIMAIAAKMPLGPRRTIAFLLAEVIAYRDWVAKDQSFTVEVKTQLYLEALVENVPLEPWDTASKPASAAEEFNALMDAALAADGNGAGDDMGVEQLRELLGRANSVIAEQAETIKALNKKAKGKPGRKPSGQSIQAGQTITALQERILELSGEVTRLRDMQRSSPIGRSIQPQATESDAALIERINGLELQLEQALKAHAEMRAVLANRDETIERLREAQRIATVAFAAQAEVASSSSAGDTAIPQPTAEIVVPKPPKQQAAEHAAEIILGERRFKEEDLLSHPFAKAWYSAVHKETNTRLATLVAYVYEGTIGQWLESMDRSSPPERTRRCAVALLRHIATVLGVPPIPRKRVTSRKEGTQSEGRPKGPTRRQAAKVPTHAPATGEQAQITLSPWASSRFDKIAKLTGITLDKFESLVRGDLIESWRQAQIARGTLDTYQSRWVTGVAKAISEQLGAVASTMEALAKPTKPPSSPKASVAAKKPVPREKPARAPRTKASKPVSEDRYGLTPWAWGHFRNTAQLTGITFEYFRAKVRDGTIDAWRDEQRLNGLLSEYQWRFVADVAREVATMFAAGTDAQTSAPQRDPPEPDPLEVSKEPAALVEMTLEQAVNGAALFGFLMDQEAVGQYTRLHEAGYVQSLMLVCQAAPYNGALKNYVASRMEAINGRIDDSLIQDAVELERHVVAFVPIWNEGGCLDESRLERHALQAGREDGVGPMDDPASRPEPAPVVWPTPLGGEPPKPSLDNGQPSEINEDLIRRVKSLNRRHILKARLATIYDRLKFLRFFEDLWDLFRIVEENLTEQRIEWLRSNTDASDHDVRGARELCRFVKNDLGVIDHATHRLSQEGLAELVRRHANRHTL